ncbi:hypothetical protein J5N97_010241 [Dioscorea zingiberensis]|uniref:Peptidase M16 N-terminal domain-containing protein n=1 Tax=Dioscorea zingiberensis TaxID=325984 RepID=A0A9D5CYS2_9LILI|nr:hypothetical protein J5N97_010241 [Dioscorea zingiberensis]
MIYDQLAAAVKAKIKRLDDPDPRFLRATHRRTPHSPDHSFHPRRPRHSVSLPSPTASVGRFATESTTRLAHRHRRHVWIDAGSRFETEETNGTAHFLEHMIFKGDGRSDGERAAAWGGDREHGRASECLYFEGADHVLRESLPLLSMEQPGLILDLYCFDGHAMSMLGSWNNRECWLRACTESYLHMAVGIPTTELFARIDAVDASTVKRVANRFIFDQDVAIAAMGPIKKLPDYNWFRRRTYLLRY